MSFFFKALMAYSFPVALYWASSTWKTTEKLYFKQSRISLSYCFYSNWCQLFPSTPVIPKTKLKELEKHSTSVLLLVLQQSRRMSVSVMSFSQTALPELAQCFGSTSEFPQRELAKFWDPRERNDNGVLSFSTLRTALKSQILRNFDC